METAWPLTSAALEEALAGYAVHVLPEGQPLPGLASLADEPVHESPWVRDYGPLQIRRGARLVWLDAPYLAGRPGDDAIPRHLATLYDVPVEPLDMPLVGGALAADGAGFCAVTTKTLASSGESREGLAEALGCRVLAVVPPLVDEPTGHVDLSVHFTAQGRVAVASLAHAPGSSPNALRLDAIADALSRAAVEARVALDIVRIPVHESEGRVSPTLNLVELEDRLLVPDLEAMPAEVRAAAFDALERATGKRVVAIPADVPALAGGGVRCLLLGLYTST